MAAGSHLKLGYGGFVALLQQLADGRKARQAADAESPQNNGVFAVAVDVTQLVHAPQGIDDEQWKQQREAAVPARSQAWSVLGQSAVEAQLGEQLLEHNKPAVGAKVLSFESQGGKRGFSCSGEGFWQLLLE